MKISRAIALVGSLVTLVQALLLAYEQEAICFNDGCAVVDSLTTVDPIFINLGGFIFFQVVFWGIWFARQKHERLRYVKIILLAGLAVEGVLVSFQYFVAQVFCSYCLLILAFIVVLNLLAGFRHIISGAIIFTAVLMGFASLQFSGASNQSLNKINAGTFASIQGSETEKRYLFFSSTCKYCEEVIASLQEGNECGVRFNPIDEITDFALADAELRGLYQPSVNRGILQGLGLEQIPVLLLVRDYGFEVINGAAAIASYFDKNCSYAISEDNYGGGTSFSQAPGMDLIPPLDESCAVNTDCEDPEQLPVQN